MTALEKFIKQIVLKQVKGSVYLVPAICDFQITEALEEEKKQGQTLPIQIVSKSEVFENYGKPFTSGRDLWDFLSDNYDFTPKT
jgi:hypothetical protein